MRYKRFVIYVYEVNTNREVTSCCVSRGFDTEAEAMRYKGRFINNAHRVAEYVDREADEQDEERNYQNFIKEIKEKGLTKWSAFDTI